MKKLIALLFIFCFSISLKSQNTLENNKPFIEVTGIGETEVVPDEIYITITLMERPENREKLSIEKQEESLKQAVKELGIELTNLTLSEAYADFRKIKTLKKDVIISKSYVLKINTAALLGRVYAKLDKINAYDAYISKVTHSKIIQLTKENRIKALKAAKEKIDYLLTSVGQQPGAALQISETGNDVFQPFQNNYRMAAKSVSNMGGTYLDDSADSEIEFKKIKITSSFLVKYEILPGK